MIVSTVRCNGLGSYGFLADNRRTNVSISRAKKCLIVVGDAVTLSREVTWFKLLAKIRLEGNVFNTNWTPLNPTVPV